MWWWIDARLWLACAHAKSCNLHELKLKAEGETGVLLMMYVG